MRAVSFVIFLRAIGRKVGGIYLYPIKNSPSLLAG